MTFNVHIPQYTEADEPSTIKADTPQQDEVIYNNSFFPDISLLAIRNSMRIDGTVTTERLKHATIEAISTVNQDLKPLRLQAEAAHGDFYSLNDEEINGEYLIEYQYKRAVYCLAVANLYERYRSYDNTKEGYRKGDELLESAGDLRRDYHHTVRDMLNQNRMIVELI